MRNTAEGIQVVELPDPAPSGVRVSVTSSGICGSDLHMVSFGPSTVTLGHEFCGRLDDGTPVAVLPAVRCGRCVRCRAGQVQQCTEVFGSLYGTSLDGGLADHAWVDPSCATPIPPSLALEVACLVEPIAVALHGVHRSAVSPGARVLVIGAGPIGLWAVAVAMTMGASVDVEGHRPERVAAERLGAGRTLGNGYDVVLDAAGTQGAMDQATARVRPGGTIGVLANYWEPVSVGMGLLMKEVILVPSFTYGHFHQGSEFEEAVQVLVDTPDLPAALITHRFPLDEAAEAFRVAGDRTSGAIKVVVVP